MQLTRIGVAALATIAIALLTAVGGRGGDPRPTDRAATDVEAAIASSNLGHRLEVALGDGFGGVWFEPSTAQLHVGVASSGADRRARAVAARVGLEKNVTETPVRSSWGQLRAAQASWDRRLGDLFGRSEVTTSLAPDRNSVEVELASSVPTPRRTALERAAAASAVAVSVSTAPESQLGYAPQARCVTFKAGASNCEPPIVAGVTIKSPKEAEAAEEFEEEGEGEFIEDGIEYEEFEQGKQRFSCSAGPAVILRDRAAVADAKKTYLLTAGHCIDGKKGGGGAGGKWAAYDKGGVEHEIGPAVTFQTKVDVGVIEVKPGTWAKAKPTPVVPTIADWDTEAESDPFPVILELTTPVKGTKTCISSQQSGIKCGKISEIELSIKPKIKGYPKVGNLVEVEYKSQKGDSGAPWFSESEYQKEPRTGYVEGTHVGRNTATGNAVFQPLSTGLASLDNENGLDLELLTRTNQRRFPGFKSAEYPATASAKSTTAEELLTAAGFKAKCTEYSFDGEIKEPGEDGQVDSIKLTPTYSKCTQVEGGAKVEIAFGTGAKPCYYLFTAGVDVEGEPGPTNGSGHASVHIKCAEGEKVKVTVSVLKLLCLEIPAQTLTGVHYTTEELGGGVTGIGVSETIEGLEYVEKGVCGSETRKDGLVQGHIALAGTGKESKSVSISHTEP